MQISTLETLYACQVEVGCLGQHPVTAAMFWHPEGLGCLIHPEVVLTAPAVWQKVSEQPVYRSQPMVKIGAETYSCVAGIVNNQGELAMLRLDRPAKNRAGESFQSFPRVAEVPSQLCQPLMLISRRGLAGRNALIYKQDVYSCLECGHVAWLKSEHRVLHALAGLTTPPTYLGQPLIDSEGTLHGLGIDFLSKRFEPNGPQPGYLVFAPLHVHREAIFRTITERPSETGRA